MGQALKFLFLYLGLGSLALGADLPVLAQLPDFHFQNSLGRTTTLKDLAGKVWVADFIFTRCGGQCPILSAKMAELGRKFEKEKDFRLVSFTVDPQNDTPQVLAEYAKRFQAPPASWYFLRGPKAKMDGYIRDGFKLAGGNGDEIAHSFRFVLVDKTGQIRGYYAAVEPEKIESLKADLQALLRP